MLHSRASCICCIRLFCTGVASRSASVTCRVGVPEHGLVDVMFSDVGSCGTRDVSVVSLNSSSDSAVDSHVE